jgi:RecB family endonuclease NucS
VEEGLKLITYEKKVKPGFIDIYAVDSKGKMVIIEIKRKTAGKEAALQLAKYVDSVKNMVNREVRGILVAPTLAKGVQKLLVTLGLDFRRLDPKRCAEIVRETETKKLEDFFP